MSKTFAWLWRLLGVVLITFTLLAVVSKFKNWVLFFPAVLGICCLLLPLVAKIIRKKSKKAYRIWRGIFLTFFFIFIAYFTVVSVVMGVNIKNTIPENETCDIIVLGCGIDGRLPDIMLSARLDTAAEYLKAHPDARVVCCGGFGVGKPYSEADVMRNYLVSLGVENDRIYLDEQSTSTQENIRYAKQLLDGLDGKHEIAVCSSNYHVYRAKEFAKKEGLGKVYTLPSPTPAHIFPAYWIREFVGISRLWILGY